MDGPRSSEDRGEKGALGVAVAGVNDWVMEDVASNSVLRPVSQDPFNGRGLIEHRAAGVEETYGVGGILHQEPKPLFALA